MATSADQALVISDHGYGKSITFDIHNSGDLIGKNGNFIIEGFIVAGIKKDITSKFTIKSLEEDKQFWEEIAVNQYNNKTNAFEVILVLKPKISLNNCTYSEERAVQVLRVLDIRLLLCRTGDQCQKRHKDNCRYLFH